MPKFKPQAFTFGHGENEVIIDVAVVNGGKRPSLQIVYGVTKDKERPDDVERVVNFTRVANFVDEERAMEFIRVMEGVANASAR